MRKPQGYRQTAAEGFFCLFLLCLPYWQSLLLASICGTLSILLLTCLLMFVAARSPEIYRAISTCLKAFPLASDSSALDRKGIWVPMPLQVVALGPSLAPSFQRPPPIFS